MQLTIKISSISILLLLSVSQTLPSFIGWVADYSFEGESLSSGLMLLLRMNIFKLLYVMNVDCVLHLNNIWHIYSVHRSRDAKNTCTQQIPESLRPSIVLIVNWV